MVCTKRFVNLAEAIPADSHERPLIRRSLPHVAGENLRWAANLGRFSAAKSVKSLPAIQCEGLAK